MNQHLQFITELKNSINNNMFVKISLANYKGEIEGLKNCYIKKINIKHEIKLSFTYRYQTKDIVKNYTIAESIILIDSLIGFQKFKVANLFTLENDFTLECVSGDKLIIKKNTATLIQIPSLEHNQQKNRLIKADDKVYLKLLKITDEKGNVINNAQDKYKQINRYVELLSPLIKNLPKHQNLHIADMGSGKGYLTFALYDYLTYGLQLTAHIIGVEYRKDLVDLCNTISAKSNFTNLQFAEGTIENYETKQLDVLIALHACDTATDDAIYKGITEGAHLIVVAPCCHKQIRKEIEKQKTNNELDFLLKHGIFLERQAEMLTDGLRSLLLEYSGYTTKVFEFISDAHTPKNIMIVAEKKQKTDIEKEIILQKIKASKLYFGIKKHHLEMLLEKNQINSN